MALGTKWISQGGLETAQLVPEIMKLKITEHTKLKELNLPYPNVIWEEIFMIMPLPWRSEEPSIVSDLVVSSYYKLDEVIRRLRELLRLTSGVSLNLESFIAKKTGNYLVYNPKKTLEEPNFFHKFFKDIKLNSTTILIISDNVEKSFSSAMHFRQLGHKNSFHLNTGIKNLSEEELKRLNLNKLTI